MYPYSYILYKYTLQVCGVCVCVYVPLLSSCVCSGNEPNLRAPTLISFSIFSAAMSNGLGSFSHTIATVCIKEN